MKISSLSPLSLIVVGLLLATGSPLTLDAQPVGRMPAGTTVYSGSATAIYQFSTDLDAGGDFSMTRLGLEADVMRSLGNGRGIGIGFDYYGDGYSFGDSSGDEAIAPWDTIHNLSLGIGYSGNFSKEWSFRIIPSITSSGESSASFSDSLTYGLVFAAARTFNQKLTIGLGAGVFHGMEKTRAYPFLAIRWQFAPGWTLQNPFRPGPAGPAGLEVAYKTDSWEFGVGGAYRSNRFRLADDGDYPNGIGENNSVPLFVRVSRPLNDLLTLDAYAGMLVGGSLKVETPNGTDLLKSDYEVAPLIALSISGRF